MNQTALAIVLCFCACTSPGDKAGGKPFTTSADNVNASSPPNQDDSGPDAASGAGSDPTEAAPVVEPADAAPVLFTPAEPIGLNGPAAVHFGVAERGAFAPQVLTLRNTSDAPLTASVSLSDTSWATLSVGSVTIAANSSANVTVVANINSTTERIYSSVVRASANGRDIEVPVYAAVGDPALPSTISFTETRWGKQAMRGLPRAPHPQTSAANEYLAYVHMSLPKNFRKEARAIDVEIALHGHGGVLPATLSAKKYVQHAYYSNRNAVLIVPQGAYDVSMDDFGQLRSQDGVRKLIDEVLIVLYREQLIDHPVVGRVSISAHSGGYNSLSDMLTKNGVPGGLSQVVLLDALYGAEDRYRAWANKEEGQFVSAFQSLAGNGPTIKSLALASALSGDGLGVTRAERRALPEVAHAAQTLFQTTYADHGNVPSRHYNLGEFWRNSSLRPKDPPRPIVRVASHDGAHAVVSAYVEPYGAGASLRVYTSPDGTTFTLAGETQGAGLTTASVSAANGVWVRATARYPGFGESGVSDTYFVRSGVRRVVVVDAFDRMYDGAMTQDTHDFSARIGSVLSASDAVTTCADEAVETGDCVLTGASVVVWNAGLSSRDNPPIDVPSQSVLSSYLSAGGRLVANGAELGYALDSGFLSNTLKVSGYSSATDDDAGVSAAQGEGALASVGAFAFGGGGSYAVEFPDVFRGGTTVLRYSNGKAAGLVSGNVASVGFPLETIDDTETRTRVVQALVEALAQ